MMKLRFPLRMPLRNETGDDVGGLSIHLLPSLKQNLKEGERFSDPSVGSEGQIAESI